MKRTLLSLLLCVTLMIGCVQPYQPNTGKKKLDNVTVVTNVSPKVAFSNYQKTTADNFRSLAQDCLDGKFEYVSELVDASKKLDKDAKDKRSAPIDAMVKDALGNDKLDKAKAAEVLNKIADDLDPAGKVIKDKKTSSIQQLLKEVLISSAPVPLPTVTWRSI